VSALALPALPALAPVRRRMLAAWAVALAAGALAFALADYCAHAVPRASALEELAYYPSGRHLEPATIGHAESAADLAWIRAVQYYGEHRRRDNRFERMYHVFDILTTLAPHFESPYIFGAFALSQEGGDFPHAEMLIQKGLDANPTSSWLAFEAGFLYYVRPGRRDLAQAAEYFERASRLPDPPQLARRFAASARQNSGSLAVAYELWQHVRDESNNRYMREMAAREMDRIRRALASGRVDLARNHVTSPVVLLGSARVAPATGAKAP